MKKQIAASLLCLVGVATGYTAVYADEVTTVPAPAQEEQVIVDQGGSLRYVPKSQAQTQQNAVQAPQAAPAPTVAPQQQAPVAAPQPTQPQLPPGVQLTPEQQKMLTKDQQKLLNSVVNPTVPTANQ